jgi:hypothetical protein
MMKVSKLTIRDFAFVRGDKTTGPSYQQGAFAILVGRGSYSCTYKGLTFSFGHESIQSAVEACNKRAQQIARKLIPSAYQQGTKP